MADGIDKIEFDVYKDRQRISVMDEAGKVPLAEISGYDLNVKFNMKDIHSIEEAEEACDAMSVALFRMMFSQLLEDSNQ